MIFGSRSLQNSCTAIHISCLGGHVVVFIRLSLVFFCWGSKMLSSPTLTDDLRGVDVKPPFWLFVKCTWWGWCEPHVASSASSSSKYSLPAREIFWLKPDKWSMPVPWLTVTMPRRISNASCCSSFSQDVDGWALWIEETLLCCCFSWTCSRSVCCFSNRVDSLLISLDCTFISSACLRCKCDRSDSCIWWAISSSTILASSSSWPLRAWASAESWRNEALLRASSSRKPWALVTFMPHSLLNITEGYCLQGTVQFGACLCILWVHAGLLEKSMNNIFIRQIWLGWLDETVSTNNDSMKCP